MMYKEKIASLFTTFFKIGAFTFGGGYAMIPFIHREIVDNKKWLTEEEISDVITIAESTPGPIAINAATFVGLKVAGFWGAVMSTLGVVLPSFSIIVLISIFYEHFKDNQILQNAFWGIRIAVVALIINAFLKMFKQCPKNWVSLCLALVSFVTVLIFNVSALILIAVSAVCGIIYYCAIAHKGGSK